MPAHGHPDRTPSMRLDLQRHRWWCFGCSPTDTDGTPKAGDVIDWVSRSEGVDWRAAIEILDSRRPLTNAWADAPLSPRPHGAQMVGQADPPHLGRTTTIRVQRALDAAWIFYTTGELHHRGIRYLADRGIDVEILERHNRRFEVGHTPTRADALIDWMRHRGFTDDELVDAGLAHRHPERHGLTEFYRHRVLIPVRDSERNLAGFIGRNIGDPRWPKYTNPPRTLRYDKSVNLYQPLPAPEQPAGRVIVVEGTLDELSPRQLAYVLDLHRQPPLIAMDGDEPGRASNDRLAAAAAALGRTVVAVSLPDGHDPASWVAERGPSGLAALWRQPDIERQKAVVRLEKTVMDFKARGRGLDPGPSLSASRGISIE
jgi:DNA primase